MRNGGALAVILVLAGLLHAAPLAAEEEPPPAALEEEAPDYDPWQPFNEWCFAFNYRVLDRFIMKPLGRAWDWVLPDPVQRSLDRAFGNLDMPRRVVNHLLQARPRAAGEEAGRFLVDTTIGVVGLFDMAGRLGLHPPDADTGQTLGVWGIGAGPYLVLPFFPPFTVRDAIGYGVDGALDPVGYIVPIPFVVSVSVTAVRRVNSRSLQPAAFENVEETVFDLYSAVRNGYLQRRRYMVHEGCDDSPLPCHHARPGNPEPPGP